MHTSGTLLVFATCALLPVPLGNLDTVMPHLIGIWGVLCIDQQCWSNPEGPGRTPEGFACWCLRYT